MIGEADLEGVAVFANPTAGGGRARGVWRFLLGKNPALAGAWLLGGGTRAEAAAVLEEALSDEASRPRRLVVLGGDGTVHLAAQSVVRLGLGSTLPVGLVHAGTGSDLARCLGLPRRPEEAFERALRGMPKPVDLLRLGPLRPGGEVGARFCVNALSAGVTGLIGNRVNALQNRGSLSYVKAIPGSLAAYRPVPVRVALDGEPWFEGRLLLLAAANGSSFGNGLRIAPPALPDDGWMDVVLAEPLGAALPLRLGQLLFGAHLGRRGIHHRRARRLSLEPMAPLPPFDLDGEVAPSGVAEVSVVPGGWLVVG